MIIGIDLDNTIIRYDKAFLTAAKKFNSAIKVINKKQIRDKIRQMENGEQLWQRLQKEVYGMRYPEAEIMPGFEEFMSVAVMRADQIYVVSHKTKYLSGDKTIELRRNMNELINKKGLLKKPFLLRSQNIFFENTRELKIRRIKRLKCDFFIDDLLEVLSDSKFPKMTKRILLSKEGPADLPGEIICLPDWYAVKNFIFHQ